ncbi:unnamed protein product, partial [Protopolystoma xenopodis]
MQSHDPSSEGSGFSHHYSSGGQQPSSSSPILIEDQRLRLLEKEYSCATIENISVWGCEFTPTVREGMKAWNMTVQYWLASHVYQRCPGPKLF